MVLSPAVTHTDTHSWLHTHHTHHFSVLGVASAGDTHDKDTGVLEKMSQNNTVRVKINYISEKLQSGIQYGGDYIKNALQKDRKETQRDHSDCTAMLGLE